MTYIYIYIIVRQLHTPTWVLLLFRGVVATIWLRWCRCEARHPTHKHTQQSTRFNNHSLANFGCRFGFDPVCACKPSNHASNGWVPRPDSDVLVSFRPSKTHRLQHALSLFCIALYAWVSQPMIFYASPREQAVRISLSSVAFAVFQCHFSCFIVVASCEKFVMKICVQWN